MTKEYSYQINEKYRNGGLILPNPAQKLPEEDLYAMVQSLKASNDISYVARCGSGIEVIIKNANDCVTDCIENILPKKPTKKEIDSQIKKSLREKVTAEKAAHQKSVLSNHNAVDWIDCVFGESVFGPYNKTKMIEFITGDCEKFDGVLNHHALHGLKKIDAVEKIADNGYQPDFEKIKESYQAFICRSKRQATEI